MAARVQSVRKRTYQRADCTMGGSARDEADGRRPVIQAFPVKSGTDPSTCSRSADMLVDRFTRPLAEWRDDRQRVAAGRGA